MGMPGPNKWGNEQFNEPFTKKMRDSVEVLDAVLHGNPGSVSQHDFLEAVSTLQSGIDTLIKLAETARSVPAQAALTALKGKVVAILQKANIEVLDVNATATATPTPEKDRPQLVLNAGQSMDPTPRMGG